MLVDILLAVFSVDLPCRVMSFGTLMMAQVTDFVVGYGAGNADG